MPIIGTGIFGFGAMITLYVPCEEELSGTKKKTDFFPTL